ncbi:MAG TPA: ROK family transcriptional regulator [Candidatus Dormibacteraeota bacterium]|nr:ROK family transcriptional regulator [Candidatus Dormibacteraeota bacterium]
MTFPSKATHQQTRAHNAALVLRALYDFGPISRADVARLSGLTRTTVGDVVGTLIEDGLAREIGRGPSTGGKAPILLELIDGARLVIGLDLGENEFRAALVDLRGQVQRTIDRPVIGLGGDERLGVVHELIDALSTGSRATLLGIGVGTPGIVDAATGTIRWAVSLDWQDLPLGEILRARHGVPVEVANDSRAAALAIELFSGQRRSNLVAIRVGLGVGAGVVLGGELFHGDGFGAGEIGHVVVEDDGSECRCGRFGCLETVANSRAILEQATRAARTDPESPLGRRLARGTGLSLEDVRGALDDGDETARRIVVTAGRFVGRAIAGMIGVLDIEHVVLHGSVAQLGEPWLAAVRDEARRRSLGLLSKDVSIELAPPIGDLVVMGASALLLTAELGLAGTAGLTPRAAA